MNPSVLLLGSGVRMTNEHRALALVASTLGRSIVRVVSVSAAVSSLKTCDVSM